MMDPKEIIKDLSNLTSSRCVCGHPVQAHYPLTDPMMTACKDEACDCLEFEGV